MPRATATNPNPAIAPVVIACRADGFGPSQTANSTAPIIANAKLRPNALAGGAALPRMPPPPVLAFASRCHALPNRNGEYHNPPRTKLDTAATSAAHRFTPNTVRLLTAA